jgi:hypothetical protein
MPQEMNRRSFGLLAGILIVAIFILTLVAGWLILSIADRDFLNNATPIPWITATFQPENKNLLVNATPTWIQTVNPLSVTPIPTLTPLSAPALPNGHPTAGPEPQTCIECHQNIHGGGG